MRDENKERWQSLCERAAVEQDPQKLLLLVRELNDALKEREARLHGLHTAGSSRNSQQFSDSEFSDAKFSDSDDGQSPTRNS